MNLKEVKDVINNKVLPSKERDVVEVKNYYKALEFLNVLSKNNTKLLEKDILTIHNLVEGKKENSKQSYRYGQNAVHDSINGVLVYLPPEAKDVKDLMKQLVEWYNSKENIQVPIPIKAGILAYWLVTIHPFWDGNGRTSRLLATYVLKANNYDLKGFYVMEEFYDKYIQKYYEKLQMGLNHNFYFGRNNADLTEWLEYFLATMSDTFDKVGQKVKAMYNESKDKVDIYDTLDKRERWVVNYILEKGNISSNEIANQFKVDSRTARRWLLEWCENGLLKKENDKQIRCIKYILSETFNGHLELIKK